MPARTGPESGRVSLRRLKAKAATDYPPEAAIRQVLASEPDEMDRAELLSKLPGWVTLIRLAESDREGSGGKPARRGP